MATEIKVPSLGESVTEATIAKWYKNIGDRVELDQLLIELETDKVTLEVNATTSGILTQINFTIGETVKVDDTLGLITNQAEIEIPINQQIKAVNPTKSTAIINQQKELILSPAAAKIAKEHNLKPQDLTATGKDNRITKADVLTKIDNLGSNSSSLVKISNADASRPTERIKMSRLRKKIAQRLKESQNTAAILTTFNEVDMSNIINIRNQYKESFEKKHQIKLGFMSFFLKASIAVLKEIPAVNAEIDGDELVFKNYYDIGVAVGTEQGLVVPIVRDADKLSFAQIEQNIVGLGKKARDGKLTIQDLTGGTFTISNGGVYGSLLSTPILNPPQAGILGMHKTQDRPVVINGKIEIRPMMYLALSYDHRIIDGKEAVTFLVRVKEFLEDPARLLFDL